MVIFNDESKKCQNFAVLTIQKLLNNIDASSFNDIFSVTKDWLQKHEKVLFK